MIDEYSQDYLDKNKKRFFSAFQVGTGMEQIKEILQIIGYLPIVVPNFSTGESEIRFIEELTTEDYEHLAMEKRLKDEEKVFNFQQTAKNLQVVAEWVRWKRGGDGM